MAGKTNELAEFLGFAGVFKDHAAAGAGTTTPALEDGMLQRIDCSAATRTIAAPTFRGAAVASGTVPLGTVLRLIVKNTSGGALTLTWNAAFKVVNTAPATGNQRAFEFVWDGTNWVQTVFADVAN